MEKKKVTPVANKKAPAAPKTKAAAASKAKPAAAPKTKTVAASKTKVAAASKTKTAAASKTKIVAASKVKAVVKSVAAKAKAKVASKPKAPAVEKNKYSPEELQEFKELILSKIAKAEKDLDMLQQAVAGSENDVSDTAPTFKTLEEGSNVLLKEENQKLAARQQKFIRDLRAALIRIENGTYGICQATGKLIPKERLMIVPHATMTVEAKEASKKRR